jgi:putative Mg2+ transporter-C (MgtC) family protein
MKSVERGGGSMELHWEWYLRILIAVLCGGLIGDERRNRNKEAGIRTHSIIALSSALIMIVSKYGFADVESFDAARMAAQVVSGVGFLGAGIIFIRHGTVSGLTTAAGMWATSGVGCCIGAGLYDVGIISTICVIGLQSMFHRGVLRRLTNHGQLIQMEIEQNPSALSEIQNILKDYNISTQAMSVKISGDNTYFIEIEGLTTESFDKDKLLEEMMAKEYVKMFTYG